MLSKRWIGFCIRALSYFGESLSLKENIIWPRSHRCQRQSAHVNTGGIRTFVQKSFRHESSDADVDRAAIIFPNSLPTKSAARLVMFSANSCTL